MPNIKHVLFTIISVTVLLAATLECKGQPVRADGSVGGGWIVTLPKYAEILDDQRPTFNMDVPWPTTVVTEEVHVNSLDDIAAIRPTKIPLYQVDPAGNRIRGHRQRYDPVNGIVIGPPYPNAVWLDGSQYRIHISPQGESQGGVRFDYNNPPPETPELAQIRRDIAAMPPPFQNIDVVYGPYPQVILPQRGPWAPQYALFDTPGGQTGQLISQAIDRTQSRFSLLMPDNLGPTRIAIVFEPVLADGQGGATFPVSYQEELQDLFNRLYTAYDLNFETGTEGPVYLGFPLSSSIPVTIAGPATVNVTHVDVASALRPTFFLPVLQPQVAFMQINLDAISRGFITLDPRKGTIPGKVDIDSLIFHETVHALGFWSQMNSITSTGRCSNWDLFRFNALFSSQVSPSAWSNPANSRALRPGQECNYVTGLNDPTRAFRASTGTALGGDGYGAGHWKEQSLLPTGTSSVGIMDPLNAKPGTGQWTRADLQAITTIGWNLDVPTAFMGPGDFPTTLPANNTVASSMQPQLEWAASPGADRYYVTVYRRVATMLAEVAHLPGLTGTGVQIAEGVLAAGNTYEWYVVSENDLGFGSSNQGVFTAPGICGADFDANGALTAADLFDFLNAWFLGYPSADYNGDGANTAQDIFDFLNSWFAGC